MLTELRIQNFKGWADTGKIRLAPLTVFFGTNSSGKSSLGQLLLMLKQTAQSPDRQRVLHPGGDEKSPIDLGSFEELIHGHNRDADLTIEIAWRLPSTLTLTDVLSNQRFSGRSMGFSTTIGLAKNGSDRLVCRRFGYRLGDLKGRGGMNAGLEPDGKEPSKYQLRSGSYGFTRQKGRGWPLPEPTRFYGFPDETIAYYQNADIVKDLTLELERELGRLLYLGPLREFPRRSYMWTGEVPENVGFRGENTIAAILAARGRQLSAGPNQRYRAFEVVVASWLERMGIITDFSVEPVAKGRRDFEVHLRIAANSEAVKLPDVGFGVSQVLPVVAQCFYAQPHATILMEQPEIHLHPSVQMALADLFIEAIQSRETGKDRNVQLIVESHSEHFLRRLQRRIADETISSDQVAAYFCNVVDGSSKLTPIGIDEYGNITNWPADFFGDPMEDVAEMSKHLIRRRAAKGGK